MMKVTVYTEAANPRIEYTLKIVFNVVLGIDYSIETQREKFISLSDIKINYSQEKIDSSLQVFPCGLLTENSIHPQEITVSAWHDLPIFFQTESSEIPFDLFSAVFYLVTRYEEYLPFVPDKHGRFEANQSLAWQEMFLKLPLVDLWGVELAKKLKIADQCPNIQCNNYSFRLTIDVDFPWRYINKGHAYTLGKVFKDFITFRFKELMIHLQVLTGQRPDPGDSYAFLKQIEKRLGHSIRYFMLSRKADTYDRNLSVGRNAFHKLIQELDNKKNVGIHPSYASSGDNSIMAEEISYLSQVLNRKIEASRQHYLRFSFPETCRNLIQHGIMCDYTMGYASQTGFRAGIARSFNYYDLQAEKETRLRIYPFQVMDRTLLSYLRQSPGEAVKEYDYYTNTIRSVGGEFISLWHNDSVCDLGEWKGWKEVFEKMIEMNEYI